MQPWLRAYIEYLALKRKENASWGLVDSLYDINLERLIMLFEAILVRNGILVCEHGISSNCSRYHITTNPFPITKGWHCTGAYTSDIADARIGLRRGNWKEEEIPTGLIESLEESVIELNDIVASRASYGDSITLETWLLILTLYLYRASKCSDLTCAGFEANGYTHEPGAVCFEVAGDVLRAHNLIPADK